MQNAFILSVAFAALLASNVADARGGGHSGGHSSSHSGSRSSVHSSVYRAPRSSARSHGSREHRSTAAKGSFRRSHPCPSTGRSSGACPGYVIDHVRALKHGGADRPDNMQWQTIEAAKAKDKWE